MLFRRKNPSPGEEPGRRILRATPRDFSQFRVFLESHEGEVYRGQIDGALVVQVSTQLKEPVQARLVDLSIQGISVVVTLQAFPAVDEGEIVGVRIEHVRDDWTISTPGLVRVIEFEGSRWVRLGLEFVNPGNLFAQLENDRGEYFNRRRAARVNLEQQLEAVLRQKGARISAKVHDISTCGFGGSVDHVQAATLRPGELRLGLTLPGELGTVEGPAELMYKVRSNGARDRVGVAFELEAWEKKEAEAIQGLVNQYLATRFRWTG